jgi:hypothetical protein
MWRIKWTGTTPFAKFKVSARANTSPLRQMPGVQIGFYRLLDSLTIRRRGPMFFQGNIMKKSNLIKLGIILSACSILAAGCAVEATGPGGAVAVSTDPGVLYADSAPPPIVDETVPIAPAPDYVWIGGGWVWGGNRWAWERGRWGRPPHPGARWVPHHYAYRNGHHTFVRGGWR